MSLADQYEVLELIGRGSYGHIRKVRRKQDGQILVRKEITYHRMTDKEKHQLNTECGILSQVKHPNIVQYIARDHVKSDSTLHLYMEYCGKGDLSKTIRECRSAGKLLPEPVIWTYFTQILLALYRCHNGIDPPEVAHVCAPLTRPHMSTDKRAVKILHRDLKPENIFLGEEGDVKLGDFGLSKMLAPEQHLANTYVGTPYYMSPELVSDLPYTHKSDIWSLGCIIYELCQLSPPFNAKTQWSLADKIKSGQYQPIPKLYSPRLREIVDLCLRVDPRQRPDTAELLDMEIFKVLRKERELVLFHRELKNVQDRLAAREEEILRNEQHLLQQAQEMREAYDKRFIQLHDEIDAQLRQKWEILAEQEIRRQVSLELEARVQAEVSARLHQELRLKIQELDLVPRAQRDFSPPTTASLGSSGASSMFSSSRDSPPQLHYQGDALMPDSPADITMASPTTIMMSTPGFRRNQQQHHLQQMFHEKPPRYGQMLPPDSPQLAMVPPVTPSRTIYSAQMLSDITNDTVLLGPAEERTAQKRPASTALSNGSPTRSVQPRRQGFHRAGTTGLLNGSRDKKEGYGLGGRGNSMDDVATVRGENYGNRSTVSARARSIIEITKMRKLVGPAPQWDADSEDAPSPFLKRNSRRIRP